MNVLEIKDLQPLQQEKVEKEIKKLVNWKYMESLIGMFLCIPLCAISCSFFLFFMITFVTQIAKIHIVLGIISFILLFILITRVVLVIYFIIHGDIKVKSFEKKNVENFKNDFFIISGYITDFKASGYRDRPEPEHYVYTCFIDGQPVNIPPGTCAVSLSKEYYLYDKKNKTEPQQPMFKYFLVKRNNNEVVEDITKLF